MGAVSFFYTWGIVLQVLALVHFARRRPDTYWLWIILIGGGLGAFVYLLVEAVPDLGLLSGTFQRYSHRGRIKQLEVMVLDNPAPGNYEELGDLYMEQRNFARAKECFDRSISARTDSPHPFYRRALSEIELNDMQGAVQDLERVYKMDPKHDFQRAAGLLADAYARTGQPEKADVLFRDLASSSTISETQYHYARFLLQQGRPEEARHWAQRILNKKATLPRYLKRRERPWFRRAEALLKQIRQPAPPAR